MIFKALCDIDLKNSNNVKVDDVYPKFIFSIYVQLLERKPNAMISREGVRSNSVLLSGTAFDPKYQLYSGGARKFDEYIDTHFFI